MKIWKVEGYKNFYGQSMMVLGKNIEEAKQVVANQYGLDIEEVGNCFVISYYTML